ncbi:hypothetical protein SAMN05444166_3013 [Singulisphaera sp. GP187]|nr:hypothetical protein SAMN05444166_3013 [Singulisphaera sp. GP187]
MAVKFSTGRFVDFHVPRSIQRLMHYDSEKGEGRMDGSAHQALPRRISLVGKTTSATSNLPFLM